MRRGSPGDGGIDDDHLVGRFPSARQLITLLKGSSCVIQLNTRVNQLAVLSLATVFKTNRGKPHGG